MRALLLSLTCLFTVIMQQTRAADAASAKAAIEVGAKELILKIGDRLVATYHIDPAHPKPFFYPVQAPNGGRVTRGYPMVKDDPSEAKDHPHQRSVWFTHGDVIPEGMELQSNVKGVAGVDFWSENTGHGRIVCVNVGKPQVSGGHAWVTTRNEWRTAEGTKIMDETRTIHLHDLGTAPLIVLEIDLHAGVVPITFGDTKEGSMGVRVNENMTEKKGGVLENADGKRTETECWGLMSAWCDYSGKVGTEVVGVAVLDDPKNPYPACWHSRGYGLMAANPFGRTKAGFPATKGRTDLVRLAKGEHLKLRYGILPHSGDAKEGKVAEHYARFVELR